MPTPKLVLVCFPGPVIDPTARVTEPPDRSSTPTSQAAAALDDCPSLVDSPFGAAVLSVAGAAVLMRVSEQLVLPRAGRGGSAGHLIGRRSFLSRTRLLIDLADDASGAHGIGSLACHLAD